MFLYQTTKGGKFLILSEKVCLWRSTEVNPNSSCTCIRPDQIDGGKYFNLFVCWRVILLSSCLQHCTLFYLRLEVNLRANSSNRFFKNPNHVLRSVNTYVKSTINSRKQKCIIGLFYSRFGGKWYSTVHSYLSENKVRFTLTLKRLKQRRISYLFAVFFNMFILFAAEINFSFSSSFHVFLLTDMCITKNFFVPSDVDY